MTQLGKYQNQSNWFKQYSNLSKSELKKLLGTEKTRIHSNAELIRFLSKLLRSKHKINGIIRDVYHQSDFERDFWKYCESNLDKEERPNLEFDETIVL